MKRVGSVEAARPEYHRAGGGSTPTPALHKIVVRPVSHRVARKVVEREHYLHSLPGGTHLVLGVFFGHRLMGVIALGAGPMNAHSIVDGALPDDCLTLTRLWLSDELPQNSESRVLGVVLRALRRDTELKFLLTYADPGVGHVGTIYQATNWLYTGLSEAMPLYDIGDGRLHHSRSLGHVYGTHSLKHFAAHGIDVRLVPQARKHRYVYFLDPGWRDRLRLPVLPYPKKEAADESN